MRVTLGKAGYMRKAEPVTATATLAPAIAPSLRERLAAEVPSDIATAE